MSDVGMENRSRGVELVRDELGRYLLQYLLFCQGICNESFMLLALMRLHLTDGSSSDDFYRLNMVELNAELDAIIDLVNVKLDKLKFKICKVSHPLGKDEVSSYTKDDIEKLLLAINDDSDEDTLSKDVILEFASQVQASNKYYVYVNLESDKETELATTYTVKEIECMKRLIKMMVNNSTRPREVDTTVRANPVFKEIKNMLSRYERDRGGDTEEEVNVPMWTSYISYQIGSTEAASNMVMTSTETQVFLNTLCADKWFYRTRNGRYGLDLKGAFELQEYLRDTYELQLCSVCKQIVLQGILCNDNTSLAPDKPTTAKCNSWHIDCFHHYITHISQQCETCGNNLLENLTYIL
ncbi:hypothetical protein TPHA_0N00860 [Tetrapisispora phaffii CBS 4417]|uniref:Non-structural maintenance of chromosomes element 1 homolog n=1 Tax=Tetrapisispora phaffii (strain ATCC 24235 / CBS 4417 / NBRC 1672 / NRRL Y-8282 / UCD 70-5) TaxID=1071381 RepID=G8C139_TETPH|nr:hypothetical protein TPHA_0N00860 [Tetrapisispora phaffii CBS 4417]CCE65867.1 hypothetical protein TPHA_0N00860 [Tetrapisispora phaffii CBS 4417]